MKEFMYIREYCRETGFPEQVLRDYCKSYLAKRFCRRTSEAVNAPFVIDTKRFRQMWESGAFEKVR